MFGHTTTYDLIRKYTIFVGAIFNDIYINREAQPYQNANSSQANTQTIDTIKVPLSYGAVDKFLARVQGDPKLQKPIAISLPRIAFELKGLKYDADNKLSRNNKISYRPTTGKTVYTIPTPVPYDFNYSVYIMVKNVEDGNKIVEQILPNFQPEWTARLMLIPQMNISQNIPLILKDVTFIDNYEGYFDKRRTLVWQLDFVLKGYLYGPISDTPQPIKQVYIKFRDIPFGLKSKDANTTNTSLVNEVYVYPGQDANSNPTSNSSISIPPDNVNQDSSWDFIVEYLGGDAENE